MNATPAYLLPDTQLWIYCLLGEVEAGVCDGSEGFIGNWHEGGHSFLFFRVQADEEVRKLVAHHDALHLIDQYTMSYEQWQGNNLKPFEAGGIVFSPPWKKRPVRPGNHSVILDPGVVFGDGTHPTTRDCLEAIELACRFGSVDRVLDLGTGTGVLALATAIHGASRILAVDYTLLAARTAHRNVKLNGLNDAIVVVNGRAQDFVELPSDLLIANIHYEVMEELIESEGFLLSKRFILSGLLHREAERILSLLDSKPVKIDHCWSQGPVWQTILGTVAE